MAKKTGGLGKDALFQRPQPQEPTNGAAPKVEEEAKRKKKRTTLILYEDTHKELLRLQLAANLCGEKITMSDIIERAVALLLKEQKEKNES